jgi:hypothetical protein
MRVVIAGGSGFLGSHLTTHLRGQGHDVIRLVRRPSASADESSWQPAEGVVDRDLVGGADVVVNVAGSPTAGNPHSRRWARELRASRVTTTRVLAAAIAETGGRAAFLAGNGISYYGDHGEQVLTEGSDSRGDALLTTVTREWQAAADPASAAGARVCILRTAPVMDRRSPPLSQLVTLTRLGLGARLGDGHQRFPLVSLRDWLGAVAHLAGDTSASGPFNICCPRTPTNREFTDALAATLGRKARLWAPAPVVRKAAGTMAPELLHSVNARPAALLARGYRFQDPDVAAVLAAGLA